jgi:nanoRNase/pAp phosphatase (c-di-AMP/oligoRNAs hydrolase)
MVQERLELLFEAIGDASSVLILPHNDPDPDAIASAVALRHLLAEKPGVEGHIAYKGIIGRAENKALVRYLGCPLQRLRGSDLRQSAPVALVDTQPGAGNNALPPTSTATIVIDHHPWCKATATAGFADVRPDLGATSTILTEYLQAAAIKPAPKLATALFYGIKTDTMGLGRGASPTDTAAYFYLQPQIDVEALAEIEYAQVPADYFKSYDVTLHATRVYDGVVICNMGPMDYPDLAAEMADLLLRLEGARWVICMGVYKGDLILAVRARSSQQSGAEKLVQEIVRDRGTAGGHGTIAGGRVPLQGKDPEQVALRFGRRALQYLKVAPETAGKPLIPDLC